MITDTTPPKPDMSVSAISGRLKALRKESPNSPKGLPAGQVNVDRTDPLYPLKHVAPDERWWDPRSMITGSGTGGPL